MRWCALPDLTVIDAVCREHLPDEPATREEFLAFFRQLSRLGAQCQDADSAVVADVLAWLCPGGVVHHYTVLRVLATGRLCCAFAFEIKTPVVPADLDTHAEGIASAMTAALNPWRE